MNKNKPIIIRPPFFIVTTSSFAFGLSLSINNIEAAQSIFSNYGIELIKIGSTNNSGVMVFNNVIKLSVKKVKDAWTNGLREKL